VQRYAGYLTDIPEIGPFAQAAGYVAGGIATVASWFGFSYPTMINEPIRVRPEPFQNGTQVIGYDTGHRLSLDPKQSLTVDPRVVASSEDEMSIAYLCSRESLFDTFTWLHSVTPLTTSIWLAPVTPYIFKRFLITGGTYMGTPTPLAFAAAPFEYWRGKITYRFEFVCSSFHRGKVALLYEPNVSQNVVIDTSLYLNKQYVWIVDLQETQEITVCIDWAFPKPWARMLDTSLFGDLGQVGFLGDFLFDTVNGYFAVVPFTTLQSPDDSDISINVYISSNDMLFNQMSDQRIPKNRPQTESATQNKGAGSVSPEETEVVMLNHSSATTDHIGEVCFGEFPISFRGLCKRFSGHQNLVPMTFLFDSKALEYQGPIIPLPFPTYASNDVNRVKNLFGYLRYGYIGLRGGVKHRFSVSPLITGSTDRTKISLVVPSTSSTTFFQTNFPDLRSKMIGTVDFVPSTNGGVEFELPFYTNNLFGISFNVDPFPSSNTMVESSVTRDIDIAIPYTGILTIADDQVIQAVDDFALGEDFNLMGFQGAPPFSYT